MFVAIVGAAAIIAWRFGFFDLAHPAAPARAVRGGRRQAFSAALAGVRVRDYVIATVVGITPGTTVYTYFANSLLRRAPG